MFEPTYEAASLIRIEPSQRSLYDAPGNNAFADPRLYEPYLQTQVNLITSDRVLNRAIAHASVGSLRQIRDAEDPKQVLREKLVVKIEPTTYLIRIALESSRPFEAAAIVNAIVASYLEVNVEYTQTRDATLKTSLNEQLLSLKELIDKKTAELKDLHSSSNVQLRKPPLNHNRAKGEDGESEPLVTIVDQEQINTMIAQMVQADIDLLTAEAELKAKLADRANKKSADPRAQPDDNELEGRVRLEFYRDPAVIALSNDIKKVEAELDHLKQLQRKGDDKALQAAQEQLTKLEKELMELWSNKAGQMRDRLQVGIAGQPQPEANRVLEQKIAMLKARRAALAKMYEQQKVEQKSTNDESFKFAYAQQELSSLLNREDQVKRNLHQVEFQSRQEQYRVVLIDKAEVPKVPVNNKRLTYITNSCLGILFVLLAGFLVSELGAIRAARGSVPAAPVSKAPVPSARHEDATAADKIGGVAYAGQRAREVQRSGGKVALVEGRFDQIDYGAVRLLQFARRRGDLLIVGVDPGAPIGANAADGPKAVTASEGVAAPGEASVVSDQRAYLLSVHSFVDLVVAFEPRGRRDLIEAIQPDVLVTSGAAAPDAAEIVRSYGGRVAMCPRV
jgi:glycerol-3-phosphate cytidylyltransferase-like family protein